MDKGKVAAAVGAAAISIATAFIAPWEGRRLQAYQDPIGIWTICDGWTQGVRRGDRATEAECDGYTKKGLEQAWEVFSRHVPAEVIEGMPPLTVAMFLSFIYNVGPGGKGVKDGFVWIKSGRHSSMLMHLQAGRVELACKQLPSWATAAGVRLLGLVRRRTAEERNCIAGLL